MKTIEDYDPRGESRLRYTLTEELPEGTRSQIVLPCGDKVVAVGEMTGDWLELRVGPEMAILSLEEAVDLRFAIGEMLKKNLPFVD